MCTPQLVKCLVLALFCSALSQLEVSVAHAAACAGLDTAKEGKSFAKDPWSALDLAPRIDEALKSKLEGVCLTSVRDLRRSIMDFLEGKAAKLNVKVESTAKQGPVVKLDGKSMDKKWSTATWIKPGTYEISVEAPPATEGMVTRVEVTLNHEKLEQKSEDPSKNLKVYEIVLAEKQAVELVVVASTVEAKCYKLSVEKKVPEGIAEDDVQLTIHGASDSDSLDTGSYVLFGTDYAIEVTLVDSAKGEAEVLLLNGKQLPKKTLSGNRVRYQLATACTPEKGEEGTLVVDLTSDGAPASAGAKAGLPTTFWVGTGIAVAGFGFGAYSYFGVASPAKKQGDATFLDKGCDKDLRPFCNSAVTQQLDSSYDKSDKWNTIAIVSASVGAVGAGIAVYSWFSSGRDASTDIDVGTNAKEGASLQWAPILGPGMNGIVASGRF